MIKKFYFISLSFFLLTASFSVFSENIICDGKGVCTYFYKKLDRFHYEVIIRLDYDTVVKNLDYYKKIGFLRKGFENNGINCSNTIIADVAAMIPFLGTAHVFEEDKNLKSVYVQINLRKFNNEGFLEERELSHFILTKEMYNSIDWNTINPAEFYSSMPNYYFNFNWLPMYDGARGCF